jgi:hypothetical protein
VDVLCCSVVVLKMPNMFTNEEYADMHFVYGFYNGNGAAMVEYRQCYPLCSIRQSKHLKMYVEL